MIRLLSVLTILTLAATAPASNVPTAVQPQPSAHADEPPQQPQLSTDASWAGTLVVAIGALFAAAVVIGLFVRVNMAQSAPAAHEDHAPAHH